MILLTYFGPSKFFPGILRNVYPEEAANDAYGEACQELKTVANDIGQYVATGKGKGNLTDLAKRMNNAYLRHSKAMIQELMIISRVPIISETVSKFFSDKVDNMMPTWASEFCSKIMDKGGQFIEWMMGTTPGDAVSQYFTKVADVFGCKLMPHIWFMYCAVAKHNNIIYRPRSPSDVSAPSVFTADSLPRVYFFPSLGSIYANFGVFVKLLAFEVPIIVRTHILNHVVRSFGSALRGTVHTAGDAVLIKKLGGVTYKGMVVRYLNNLVSGEPVDSGIGAHKKAFKDMLLKMADTLIAWTVQRVDNRMPTIVSLSAKKMKAGQKYVLTMPVDTLSTPQDTGQEANNAFRELHDVIAKAYRTINPLSIRKMALNKFEDVIKNINTSITPEFSLDLKHFSQPNRVEFVHREKSEDHTFSMEDVSKHIGKHKHWGWRYFLNAFKTITYHNVLRNDIYWNALTC
jgi:hypothetical protein